jgi:predicted lactoylglutathione lyase
MEQRLSVVTLGVADLQHSRRFYEALGWKRGNDSEEIVFFQLNGAILSLFPRDHLAADAEVSGEGSGFGGITLAYCARSRSEVDRIIVEARSCGAKILKPAKDAFWGGYSGYFADPDGHPWEVFWSPHLRLDEEGNVSLHK